MTLRNFFQTILIGALLFVGFALWQYIKVITLGLIGLLALAAVLAIGFTAWYAYEKMLMIRAGRIAQERDAHVTTITQGVFVAIRDTSHHADRWQTYTSPKQIMENNQMLLPENTQVIDLLSALDAIQRCLIVGASDSGKTTLLKWLVKRRAMVSEVIVIDPHASPDKWQNCKIAGLGRNYEEIGAILDALVRVMTKRYDDIGAGRVIEGQHEPLTIVIDEWRAIVQNLGSSASEAIKALLTESRKAAFSVFVATHSERAKPLGLEGEYDLKDGFTVVRLSIVNGQRQATIDHGEGAIPASLPGAFTGYNTGRVIEHQDILTEQDFAIEPSPLEAAVLHLDSEGLTISEIAEQVFGHKGGHQNAKVQKILDKFNQV